MEDTDDCDEVPAIDPGLVVKGSLFRASMPVLPVPVAIVCFVCNLFLPGSGNSSIYKCFPDKDFWSEMYLNCRNGMSSSRFNLDLA